MQTKLLKVIVAACFLLVSSRMAYGAGFTIILGTDAPREVAPHVQWRLGSTITQGIADFLFEVRVLKKLPVERLDPELRQELNYSSQDQYAARFFHHIRQALLKEGEYLSARAKAKGRPFTADIYMMPGQIDMVGEGTVFGFGELFQHLIGGNPAFEAIRNLAGGNIAALVDNVMQSRMIVLNGPINPGQYEQIQRSFKANVTRWENTPPAKETLPAKIGVHGLHLSLMLGHPAAEKNMLRVTVIAQTKEHYEETPAAMQQASSPVLAGVQAYPRTMLFQNNAGVLVLLENWVEPQLRHNKWATAYFGILNKDQMSVDQGGVSNILYEYMPRIYLELYDGNTLVRMAGQQFSPYVHARTLSYNLRTESFSSEWSDVSVKTSPFYWKPLSLSFGRERQILDALQTANEGLKRELFKNILSHPSMSALIQYASGYLFVR